MRDIVWHRIGVGLVLAGAILLCAAIAAAEAPAALQHPELLRDLESA